MKFEDVPTLSQKQDIEDYRALAERVPDGSTIIEIGVHKGGSIGGLADIIQRKRLQVVLVDLWDALPLYWGEAFKPFATGSLAACAENMKGLGIEPVMISTPSVKAAEFLRGKTEASMVFLDGDHGYLPVKADIEAWWPLVAHGGILAGHDYGNENIGVKQAVDEKFGDQVHTRKGSLVWWVEVTG